MPAPINIVIGTHINEDLVDRISEIDTSVSVSYEPNLLPTPVHPCDRLGIHPKLSEAERIRWRTLAAGANVFLGFDWMDPAGMARNSPKLRWIQAATVGIGPMMKRTGLDQSGITVTTAGGIAAIPLTEFALLGALHFLKGMPVLAKQQRQRQWTPNVGRQLSGTRALIVGLGSLGRQLAASFSALGVEVWGLGRDNRNYDLPGLTRILRPAELNNVLRETDILIVACPLTAETHHLIGPQQLRTIKRGAIIINVGRGPVIEQRALVAALEDGHLGGACLDVVAVEPLPEQDPLWDAPNVIISPHSASVAVKEDERLIELFLDNLERFRSGKVLRNLYDPQRGY